MEEKKLTDEAVNVTVKSLKWVCNQIPDDLGDSNEERMLKCIRLYCEKGIAVINRQKDEIERLTEELATAKQEFVNEQRYYENAYSRACQFEMRNAELQKQVDELKEKIMNLKSAMIDRVVRKSYDSLLTMPEDVEEIFGDAYESEFNKFLGQAVKDTAKKYRDAVKELFNKWDCCGCVEDRSAEEWYKDNDKIARERFGVEVE